MNTAFNSNILDEEFVTFWHKAHMVYQIEIHSKKLYPVTMANNYIFFYNFQLFATKYMAVFFIVLIFKLNGYRKDNIDGNP